MDELTKSIGDYLEMILVLQKEQKVARVTDIAKRLNVKKPAVTSALKVLSEKGLVEYIPYKDVFLTDTGINLAEELLNRHNILTKFFSEILNIDPVKAEEDACKVEHVISDGTFKRLECFLKFVMQSDNCCVNIEKFKKEYCV
jgi:Mn-dependent transcriptional regulator